MLGRKRFITVLALMLVATGIYFLQQNEGPLQTTTAIPQPERSTTQSKKEPDDTELRQPHSIAASEASQEIDVEAAELPPVDAIPLASADLPPSSEYQAKLVELPRPRMLANARAFIDHHGMADLSPEQRAALAWTLLSCAVDPVRDADAMATMDAERYALGMDEAILRRRTAMCGSITDEEFFASYNLLKAAAESGDLLALEVFSNAIPPAMIEASLYNNQDGILDDPYVYNEQHLKRAVELLENSVADGNLRAARILVHIFWPTNDEGPQRDLVRALALSKAVAYAEGATRYSPFIEVLSDKMFFYEIEQADVMAIDTLRAWASLDTLSH